MISAQRIGLVCVLRVKIDNLAEEFIGPVHDIKYICERFYLTAAIGVGTFIMFAHIGTLEDAIPNSNLLR